MNKLIVANLKMFMTYDDIKQIECLDNVVFCATSIFIPYLLKKNIIVGAQDISQYEMGAHTGEISARQLKSLDVKWTLVGHSETRKLYNDEDINKKIINGINNNLKVILCVGERKNENRKEILKKQILTCLKNVTDISNIYIAYEPIWCIGTGVTPTNKEIEATIEYIQSLINNKYNKNVKILYGGSVDKNNIEQLKLIKNVSGFLIGETSTHYEELKKLIYKLK